MVGIYPSVMYRGLHNQERLEAGQGMEERQGQCEKYRTLVSNLASIGVDETRQQHLFRILGAILLLRNLEFIKKTASGAPSREKVTVDDGEAECMLDNASFEVTKIAELLGLGAENMGDLLSKKFMTSVRKEDNYFIHLTFDQAKFNATMVAENLYDTLFNWLSSTCNQCSNNTLLWLPGTAKIAGRARSSVAKKSLIEHYIDVVDFVPLSDFEANGFDQLMTNYCSEKIQKYYCSSLFRDELQRVKLSEYVTSGGCGLELLDDCLYLLDGEAGILPLIDEHCLLSRAGQNDNTLFELIYNTHVKHKAHFLGCKSRTTPSFSTSATATAACCDTFSVKHYCGLVHYNMQGFMKFNRGEKLDKEVSMTFERSGNDVLSHIFSQINNTEKKIAEQNNQPHSRRLKSKIDRTEISITRRKVTQIISDLQSTSPIFIKCLRASPFALTEFDGKFVACQLQTHGITDLINLKMKGFSESYSWEEIHLILLQKKMYHFRDELVLEGGEMMSNSQECEKLAQALFENVKQYVNVKFWFESTSPLSYNNAQKCMVYVQVGAFDLVLFFKKSKMKDLIYSNYLIYRRKKRLAEELRAKGVLANFFHFVKVKRLWQQAHTSLIQVFRPLKLFLLRWIVRFRIQKRVALVLINRFLHRREWRSKVRRVLRVERAAKHAVCTARACVLQQHWRGFITRLKLYDSVTVVVRKRLLATKHRKMTLRIHRFAVMTPNPS